MRSAAAALAYSKAHPTIPYTTYSSIDGVGRTVDDLECARSVMADYDVMPISDMGTATRMWQRTVDKRTGTPLNGAPLYYPNYGAGKSGHIALYDAASGMAWTTPVWLGPYGAYQSKHLISISELANRCGNAYAGWGADIAGMPINFTSTAGGTNSTPFTDTALLRRQREDTMFVISSDPNTPTVYEVFRDANGATRLAVCGSGVASAAKNGGMIITCSPTEIAQIGKDAGWVGGANTPVPLPKVLATVDVSSIKVTPDLSKLDSRFDNIDKAIAAVPAAVIVEQKKPGN